MGRAWEGKYSLFLVDGVGFLDLDFLNLVILNRLED